MLIHRVLDAMGAEIDYDVAVNIYVAILTDTGSFHYSNTSPEAFHIAGEMVRRGIDPWDVAEKVYESRSADRLRLLGRVLDSLEIRSGGKVASITTTKKDLSDFSATKDALEGFINYPRSVEGTEVAVSFREEGDAVFRVSFRSKGRVDVSAVAQSFGGGGHKNASGCTVSGSLPEVKEKVFQALEAALR
jgi:phosphoesterase RecJ-like protein